MPRKQKGGDIYDSILKSSKIVGPEGSQHVKYNLQNGQSIISATGAMIYMKGSIGKAELSFDGIGQGIKKVLAGESLVYQKFTATGNGTVVLGSNFINTIMILKIKKGDEYRLSRYSFLACTDNIQISMTTQMKGIIGIGQSEGFILPIASCISGDYGYIWLSAYGNFEQESVDANDSILLDNGMFLACHNTHQYELERIGKTLFGSFLGGEGFGMKFNGPCTVYIQTKNINEFIERFQTSASSNDNGLAKDVGKGILEGAWNIMKEGGGGHKRNKGRKNGDIKSR